jgi:hypothetical protein
LRFVSQTIRAVLISVSCVAPAYAAGTVVLPDPSGLTLFALGVAGLIVGRHAARKHRDDDDK